MNDTHSLMLTYARNSVAFVRGEGTRLWDEEGLEYLDFLAGIGVNNLGHCPPKVTAAIREQAGQLVHTSNLYRIPLQEKLAQRLTATCFADQAFFCNSGAEANEAAIKLTRKTMRDRGHPGRFEIITAFNGFHGRTLATLSATAQEKVQRGFEPLMPGFRYVPFNDPVAVEKAISPYTAGILVEPIQGESGVRIPDDGYLEALRAIADRHGLLLIFDEVQTGMGRTGKFWGHQWSSMTPDIMTVAKGLASGIPMGACLATASVAAHFSPGTHASTFGGNPLACAASLATLETLLDDGVLQKVSELGAYLEHQLQELEKQYKLIKAVRVRGLMAAVELNVPAEEVGAMCLNRRLLLSCQMGTTLRMLPPLTISKEEIEQGVAIIGSVLNDLF
ncbi:MAG: aspartate aminotransferase family protein [Magnetococcales bacterium]|nr:aspartate aminotransferase family protein [Magnetococcales bacterium]